MLKFELIMFKFLDDTSFYRTVLQKDSFPKTSAFHKTLPEQIILS